MNLLENAQRLNRQFNGNAYTFGTGVLGEAGRVVAGLGKRAVLVRDAFPGSAAFVETIQTSLRASGIELLGVIDGAAPNAPRRDVARVTAALAAAKSPQLKMKLENMPVPLTAEWVDEYMGPILQAASTGNLGAIRELQPHELMAASGIAVDLPEVSTIKPIDTEAPVKSVKKTRRVLAVEEHSVCGGLAGAVAEALGPHCPARIEMLGIQDRFGESGDYMPLLEAYGISSRSIEARARALAEGDGI
jgi:hypothetical protein